MFRPVASEVDFPALERRIKEWWEREGILGEYLARNSGSEKRFSFIDGPITANNPMGVHHAWGRTYKDLFQRYKTMQGYAGRYQNGFDCQGLWVEVEVEKELGLKSKRDIEDYGVADFVNRCKERVLKYSAIQTAQSERLGYWMDWDNSYYTMSDENNYSIWHLLKGAHQRGLVYKGNDVMPWCPRCGTGLSEHEIVTEGYRELTHTSVYLRLPLVDREGEYLLVWTTTPWTLPANTACAVDPEGTYARVQWRGEHYYIASDLIDQGFSMVGGDWQVADDEVKGSDLVGLRYRGPFTDLEAQSGVRPRVIPWKEVSADEGIGIVHIAPGCGREDFGLSKEHQLSIVAPIDESGFYVEGFGQLTGRRVSDVGEDLMTALEEAGLLFAVADITHRYPVCWRCSEELVFRLVDEWFISMDEVRQEIMEVTKQIRWMPEFGLDRELDWLRNMQDWMISKKRYWGLALPIYQCDACGRFEAIGSKEELEERAIEGWDEFAGHSPHRPWIDAVKIACPDCGALVSRIKDVGNPWLDAGIVPYSTLGYRHERDYWERWFPADFITECFPGQFRNWFYSLLAQSALLENRPPFRAVLGHGLVKDEKGEEMHKSAGNAIWFDDAAEEIGVDVMRWLYSAANPALNMNFGYGPADEVRRQVFIPLWNVYSFFTTYAALDGFDPATTEIDPHQRPALDRWLLSKLNRLIDTVTRSLDDFSVATATRAIEGFISDASTWYVRRGRGRYWKSEADEDKASAYSTLYEALVTLIRLMAPFAPFTSEEMYQNLVVALDDAAPLSVHLTDFPLADLSLLDDTLEERMAVVRDLASLGRSARQNVGLKVRQPLAKLLVVGGGYAVNFLQEKKSDDRSSSKGGSGALGVDGSGEDTKDDGEQLRQYLLDELNVKDIELIDSESVLVHKTAKPNFAILGPRFQAELPKILAALKEETTEEQLATAVEANEPVQVGEHRLTPEDFEVQEEERPGFSTARGQSYLVAVSTEISPELRAEGLARELVRQVQETRRAAGFEVSDRIRLTVGCEEGLQEAVKNFASYIAGETLAVSLESESLQYLSELADREVDEENNIYSATVNLGDHDVVLRVERAG